MLSNLHLTRTKVVSIYIGEMRDLASSMAVTFSCVDGSAEGAVDEFANEELRYSYSVR